jgi:DNA adenine methylase
MQLFYQFGSKHLARARIMPFLLPLLKSADAYREPFIGAGAIALSTMSRYPRMPCWINDRDPAIAALWRSVKEFSDELIRRVREFHSNVSDFRAFSAALYAIDTLPESQAATIELGFQQLTVAIMRWSGHGGSPRGGYGQRYPRIGERWSTDWLSDKLRLICERLVAADARITDLDFAALIEDTSRRAVIFVDPPYFGSGSNYRYNIKPAAHLRLAALLRKTPHPWVLTYHDCPEVRRLYVWATIAAFYAKTVVIVGSEAPATAAMMKSGDGMKANPNANKTKPGEGTVPYSPHRRVNRSSPCASDDGCV